MPPPPGGAGVWFVFRLENGMGSGVPLVGGIVGEPLVGGGAGEGLVALGMGEVPAEPSPAALLGDDTSGVPSPPVPPLPPPPADIVVPPPLEYGMGPGVLGPLAAGEPLGGNGGALPPLETGGGGAVDDGRTLGEATGLPPEGFALANEETPTDGPVGEAELGWPDIADFVLLRTGDATEGLAGEGAALLGGSDNLELGTVPLEGLGMPDGFEPEVGNGELATAKLDVTDGRLLAGPADGPDATLEPTTLPPDDLPDTAEGSETPEGVDEPGGLEEPACVDSGLDEAGASELIWGLDPPDGWLLNTPDSWLLAKPDDGPEPPPDGGELAAETGEVVDATLVDLSELPEPSPLLAALVTDGELTGDKPRLPLLVSLGGWDEATLAVDECGGELAVLDCVFDGDWPELAADHGLDAPEVVDG